MPDLGPALTHPATAENDVSIDRSGALSGGDRDTPLLVAAHVATAVANLDEIVAEAPRPIGALFFPAHEKESALVRNHADIASMPGAEGIDRPDTLPAVTDHAMTVEHVPGADFDPDVSEDRLPRREEIGIDPRTGIPNPSPTGVVTHVVAHLHGPSSEDIDVTRHGLFGKTGVHIRARIHEGGVEGVEKVGDPGSIRLGELPPGGGFVFSGTAMPDLNMTEERGGIHGRVDPERRIDPEKGANIALGGTSGARQLIEPDEAHSTGRRGDGDVARFLLIPDGAAIKVARSSVTDLGKSTRATVAPKLDPRASRPTPRTLGRHPVGDHGDIAMKTGGLPVSAVSNESVIATPLVRRDEILETRLKLACGRNEDIFRRRHLDGGVHTGGMTEVVGAPRSPEVDTVVIAGIKDEALPGRAGGRSSGAQRLRVIDSTMADLGVIAVAVVGGAHV